VQLHPDVTPDMFSVNAKRYLPRNPAISASELTNKQLLKDLERNAFVVHRCTLPQIVSPFSNFMNTFLIFLIAVLYNYISCYVTIHIVAMFAVLDLQNTFHLPRCNIYILSPYPIPMPRSSVSLPTATKYHVLKDTTLNVFHYSTHSTVQTQSVSFYRSVRLYLRLLNPET